MKKPPEGGLVANKNRPKAVAVSSDKRLRYVVSRNNPAVMKTPRKLFSSL